MRKLLLNELVRFRDCDDGATLVEYGIAITLAVTLGGGALVALSTAIGGSMTTAVGLMP